ncbi:MAG: M28 family peptidase [Acidobacteria bacterium]|nr:M28 family peptidase [Acidobacteriota bacterium]
MPRIRTSFLAVLILSFAASAQMPPQPKDPLAAMNARAQAGGPACSVDRPSCNEIATKVIGAALGPSPIEDNLRALLDGVGGRVPGTAANKKGVAWGVEAFKAARVDEVHTEKFTMAASWAEGETRVEILTGGTFPVRAVSIAWSPAVPGGSVEANVLDIGEGSDAEFARVGAVTKGALLLVHTGVLRTLEDLFKEYSNAPPVIERAVKAGAAAILWTSTREQGLLYRHQNTNEKIDRIPQVMLAREDALRIARAIAAGNKVRVRLSLPNRIGGPIEVENVIAEIRGSDLTNEVVMIGAHLDSWELGTGALDNGCNAALVVDVARSILASGVKPRRTLRFALWNGEEQGLLGSWAYARTHRADLDRIVAFLNFDEGTGRVTGFSLGGRHDIEAGVREVLKPIESWGMNEHTFDLGDGSDHVDFVLEGVPTLSANQEDANYMVNYHASSDTMDKVDLRALKIHVAYAGVVMAGLANRDERLGKRQTRAEVEALLKETGFDKTMKESERWGQWERGERGRLPK